MGQAWARRRGTVFTSQRTFFLQPLLDRRSNASKSWRSFTNLSDLSVKPPLQKTHSMPEWCVCCASSAERDWMSLAERIRLHARQDSKEEGSPAHDNKLATASKKTVINSLQDAVATYTHTLDMRSGQGGLQCPKPRCRSTRVSHTQRALRRADDGMVALCVCVECGHQWRL